MKNPNTILRDNEVHDAFGVEYLQARIEREFPLARHLEVLVDAANDVAVVVREADGEVVSVQRAFGK